MTMETIVNLIVSNGLAVVIVAYFIFKDYKQGVQQLATMDSINQMMGEVKGVLNAIERKLD